MGSSEHHMPGLGPVSIERTGVRLQFVITGAGAPLRSLQASQPVEPSPLPTHTHTRARAGSVGTADGFALTLRLVEAIVLFG
jgi:hypothetical protein